MGQIYRRIETSKLFAIVKKSSKNDVNNYRPVSLVPIFSKLFEPLVYEQLW